MITTAIIVTFNSAAVIGEALASLPSGLPVIVVDNASTDATVEIAAASGARVIRNAANLGFGMANNIGVRAAETGFVLLMNPDAGLSPGCLDTMAAAINAAPPADIVVPSITTSRGAFRKWTSVLTPPGFVAGEAAPGLHRIGFASGGLLLARRQALLDIGGFDEAIFLYFEDDDLSRRALDAGQTILHAADAQATHVGNVSSPPTPAMTYVKHWHMAWSERYVKRKFGLRAPGYWRVAESFVKMLWAQVRRDHTEEAKQLGLMNGTLGHMRGLQAADIRDTLVMERE